jgi:hypothetical protein
MNQFEQTIELLGNSNFYYIITTNMDGKYSYINKHYATSFEHLHGKVVGMPYQMTMHPDDTKICEEVAAKCFANPDQMFPATIRKHNGKGGYVFTQWEYKAMFKDDNNKEPEGVFCLGYDITKFVAEQIQLKEAESEIGKKSGLLDEIAFQHAHLIRSPLSNILGLADILDKIDIDENVRNICKMIVESSNKLDDVIREVVNKSRE